MLRNGVILFVVLVQTKLCEGQYPINMAVCADANVEQTIQCGPNEIIDIHKMTVAIMTNIGSCDRNSVVAAIEGLSQICKRSRNDQYETDGEDVYRRCQGKQRCMVDSSVVLSIYLTGRTDICTFTDTNVLQFNYSCVNVNPLSPSVAMLPLQDNREYRGSRIQIFSPNYPAHSPQGEYTVQCILTPQRTQQSSYVYFTMRNKLVHIRKNDGDCLDYIYFKSGATGNRLNVPYCGQTSGSDETWNVAPFTYNTFYDFRVIYQTKQGGGGAKFWLIVEAADSQRNPVELTVTCTGQDNIPRQTTTTSPTTLTTSVMKSAKDASVQLSDEGHNKQNQKNDTLLVGVLGVVIGLVIIVACIAIILVLLIRRRKRKGEAAPVPTEEKPRKPRPKSIQKITSLMKTKRKAPAHPDEEQPQPSENYEAVAGLDVKPKPPQKSQKPQKPEKPEKPQKPKKTQNSQKAPRPNSILKMAALIKTKGKGTKSENAEAEKVAVVKPFGMYATVDENNSPPEGAGDVDSSGVYSVPVNNESVDRVKGSNLIYNDYEDTVIARNNNNNYQEIQDKNLDDVDDDIDNADNDETPDQDENLYENVNERKVSISLPDSYPNQSRARTSIV